MIVLVRVYNDINLMLQKNIINEYFMNDIDFFSFFSPIFNSNISFILFYF
jgi:hypothetical protein